MTATAEIIQFNRFSGASECPQEPKGAQLEDGYIRIANEIMEAIALHDFTKRQYKVLMVVLRKTFGYQKKMDWIAGSVYEEMTGVRDDKALDTQRELVAMRVLTKEGRKVGINTCTAQWNVTTPQNGGNTPKMGVKNTPKTGVFNPPKRGYTKDNTKNNKDNNYIAPEGVTDQPDLIPESHPEKKQVSTPAAKKSPPPSQLDYSCWPAMPSEQVMSDWLDLRKTLRAKVTQTVINRLATELHTAHQMGFSVDDCLGLACERGWRGFKAHWIQNDANQNQNFSGATHHAAGQYRSEQQRQRAEVDAAINNWQDTSWAADLIAGEGDADAF